MNMVFAVTTVESRTHLPSSLLGQVIVEHFRIHINMTWCVSGHNIFVLTHGKRDV